MLKHCVIAAKGTGTPHDVAELTLMTLDAYRSSSPAGAPQPNKIDHKADAMEIAHFLTMHLPDKTLAELRACLT